MNKYTIIKAFERQFPSKIWKIAIDARGRFIALETRDTDSTAPSIHILDFEGNTQHAPLQIKEKEWTLESIQHNNIILKRVGTQTPIGAGIQIIDFYGQQRYLSEQHIWVDTYLDFIKIRHRNFQSGMEEFIRIIDASKAKGMKPDELSYCQSIQFPLRYSGQLPPFLKEIHLIDSPLLNEISDNRYLWSYHTQEQGFYQLHICISDRFKILERAAILLNMEKMIPQHYFKINNQIFLMSYNKQEIVSYLV